MHDPLKNVTMRLERANDADFSWLLGEKEATRKLCIAPELASKNVLQIIRALPANWLMISDGEIVGLISLKTDDPEKADIGYGVAASRQGRGFATAAVAALLPTLRECGLSTVLAETSIENAASQRVLQSNGFAAVGERYDDEDGILIVWQYRL